MPEEKKKKIAVASTVVAVLLLIILVFVMVYQLISIKAKRDYLNSLQEQEKYYEDLIEDAKDGIEKWNAEWWLERKARELGYYFPGDKKS